VTVQINSAVMRDTVDELPALAELVARSGAAVWELFFLVHVGRGRALAELTPAENEDVCRFLVDASRHGFVVRTVEAPFFRRVAAGEGLPPGDLYRRLAAELVDRLGPPRGRSRAQTKGTRDGRGIVFVGHDGTISPSGFLPLALGNVRDDDLVEVYREHPLLRRIRAAEFKGRCGNCAFRRLCGGSRARAYAATGDALSEDPGCAVGILH
jgi:radical SAM protein with 4Fe4S-binding SPASM domain